jgi:hypothetical protein
MHSPTSSLSRRVPSVPSSSPSRPSRSTTPQQPPAPPWYTPRTMLKAILLNRATTPLAVLLILAAVISLLFAIGAVIVQYFLFFSSGTHVTVPADNITIQVEPGKTHSIYHRVTGTHVTTNNPLAQLPGDLPITISDAQTQQPIEHTPFGYRIHYDFYGLQTERQGIAQFTAPESGTINLSVGGLEDKAVLYVGRSYAVFMSEVMPRLTYWIGASLIAIILGAALILARFFQPEPRIGNETQP